MKRQKAVVDNKTGLFKLLDFLEDQNPLIRNSSKNWLLESFDSFERVVDPILEFLLL